MEINRCSVAADPAGFTSEAEVMAEGDVHSNASFPYDDIDEARPLASPEAIAGTSGPVYINEDAPTGKFCSSLTPPPPPHTENSAALTSTVFSAHFNTRLFVLLYRWDELRGGRPAGELWRHWSSNPCGHSSWSPQYISEHSQKRGRTRGGGRRLPGSGPRWLNHLRGAARECSPRLLTKFIEAPGQKSAFHTVTITLGQ